MELFAEYKQLFTIFHVAAVVVGMGAAINTDILFTFFGINKKLSHSEVRTIRFLSTIVTYALGAILLTGLSLFLSDTTKYLASAKFLTKMSIVLVLCLNGYLLHCYVFKHIGDKDFLTAKREYNIRRVAFALGAVSFVSWFSAMSLGVLDKIHISYPLAFSVYLIFVGVAVVVSQYIVKKFLR
ncbi:MAG: hypothetical protein RI996_446 [Candidatus Parcubacteria bacterium]|jgi:uncharacterized membrane protein